MTQDDLYTGRKDDGVLDYLKKRRSCKLALMGDRGPTDAEIASIIQAGARVPDHGKLAPWRFVVFTGDARRTFGAQVLRPAYAKIEPDAAPAKLDLEAERLVRAPCVIAVISTPKESKHPVWEQHLSAGAAAYNLCLAANAMGYGTNWLSEWFSYNDDVATALGLGEADRLAGFIYIGAPCEKGEERPRPELKDIMAYWQA